MSTRFARPEEFEYLRQLQIDAECEVLDPNTMPCWVAVDENDKIVAHIYLRPVIFAENLLVVPGVNKLTASRACVGLIKTFESWMLSPANTTGIHWYSTQTRSPEVRGWAERLGWVKQWVGATFYYKNLKRK
jgi:hypothetical protein